MSVKAYGQLIIQATMPAESPVIAGTLWLDTTNNILKRCTNTSPYTFVSVEGISEGAPTGASYLTLGANGTLTSERILTPQNSLTATDNGAGGTYLLNLVNDSDSPGNSKYYGTNSSGTKGYNTLPTDIQTPSAVFGDAFNTSSVVAGTVCYVRVPYSGTITEWHIISNVSCTCIIDIWKANAALPVNANSITASAKPSLSSAVTNSSSTLTGWTTSVAVGDVFGFELESVSGGSPTEITLVLKVA